MNETNAVWAIQCDEALANVASALAIFNNAGTLLKSAGSGTTIFNVYLDGSGLVHAQNGTIQFNSGGTLGGSVTEDRGPPWFLRLEPSRLFRDSLCQAAAT